MPKIDQRSARTDVREADSAAEILCQQLGGGAGADAPKLLVVFADRRAYEHEALLAALRLRLPTTRVAGGTCRGQLDGSGMVRGQVVASALYGDFEVGLGVGRGLTEDPVAAGSQAVKAACRELGLRPDQLGKRHVGMVIDDGFRYKKEAFLIGMLEPNPRLVLVGGGASDFEMDPAKSSAMVYLDGEVITDAVLIVLFQTDVPWAALRSHWYEPTGQMLTITKVDASCTRALEIDGLPAAQRYADLIGVGVGELGLECPNGFGARPTAFKVGREYFMRTPWMALPDGSVLFANLLDEGAQLEVMRLGDPVASTRRFFADEIPKKVGTPSAIFAFNCGARGYFAESAGFATELATAFEGVPHLVGMEVHFELYCSFAINTTCTALAFGTV